MDAQQTKSSVIILPVAIAINCTALHFRNILNSFLVEE
jgi:hypothetical protein